MFPVGLCTKFGVSSPVVQNGTFIGFYDGWTGGRKFPVDMAGFAVNLEFLSTVRIAIAAKYNPRRKTALFNFQLKVNFL